MLLWCWISRKEISEAGRRAQWLRKTFFFFSVDTQCVRALHVRMFCRSEQHPTQRQSQQLWRCTRDPTPAFSLSFTELLREISTQVSHLSFSTHLCRLIGRQFEHLLLQDAANTDCDTSRHPFLHDKVETCTVMWRCWSYFVMFSCKRLRASLFLFFFTWMCFASAPRSDEPVEF